MTKVIYVRHGQTEWNIIGRFQGQSDVELSNLGKKQAKMLSEKFPVEKVDAVYASDLKRAHDTAKEIASRFGLLVETEKALREMNFGAWEGLTYQQIIKRNPEAEEGFWGKPDLLEIPDGESFEELQTRAWGRIHELVEENDGKTIVVVAHGAILRTLLAEALHMSLRHVWDIRQSNTAVSIVSYDKEFRSIELVNSTAHLVATAM